MLVDVTANMDRVMWESEEDIRINSIFIAHYTPQKRLLINKNPA